MHQERGNRVAKNEHANPFQVLGLPTTATNADIVARGQELGVGAEADEQMLIHQAIEALITHPLKRLEYELFEVPDAQYEDQTLEKLVRLFKRNPIHTNREEAPAPALDDVDLTTLMQLLLDELLTVAQSDLKAAIYNPPFGQRLDQPLGVRDVIF